MPENTQGSPFSADEIAAGARWYGSAEEQDLARLREALARTPDERFSFLMELMQLQQLMQEANLVKKRDQ